MRVRFVDSNVTHGQPDTEAGRLVDEDIEMLLRPRPQAYGMSGFDDAYADFPDYILRCTHRIWEQKNLGLIRTHYANDCLIQTINGDVVGIEAVVTNTLGTLAGFPDRTLYAEDVIWNGDAAAGFFSSHRILSHMTNRGPSEFGAATDRSALVRTIADCEVRGNRIGREWLVRDNLSLAWQLGLNPHALARKQSEDDRNAGTRWTAVAAEILGGAQIDYSVETETCHRLMQTLDHIWNQRMFGDVLQLYSTAACYHGPSGRELHGPHAVIGNIIALLATLPDGRLVFDQLTEIPAADGRVSVAVRWRFAGTHTKSGLYGPASGKRLVIPGISHFRLLNQQVEEEWTVFDEFGVMRQIYARDEEKA